MKDYTITRDGAAPLRFHGEIVAEAAGAPVDSHYHNLTVYQTVGGKFILEVNYFCTVEGKRGRVNPGRYWAFVLSAPELVPPALSAQRDQIPAYAYLPPVGAKNGPARRQEILDSIHREFDIQVGKLLDHDLFAEEIQ